MNRSKEKVLLGMSGGVDSSVAAYLLQKNGYDVIGVTLEMFKEETSFDISKNSNDAKNVCKALNIPHYSFNVEENFKKFVIQYFISEYESGKTPNPCVICNRYVKFEGLIEKAKELGIRYIATGHYASIDKKKNRYYLKKGIDEKKDQSYFLYNLNQEQLSKSVFPLGEYTKEQIREIAKEINLPTYSKPDSQEVCFIKDNDYKGYIQKHSNQDMPQGQFVDKNGNILGYHKGIRNYTVGQRRNLGITTGKPMYVLDIDSNKNQIILGSNEELFSTELDVKNLNWVTFDTLTTPMNAKAKIRYAAKECDCLIEPKNNNTVKIIFNAPQRAITKGQAIVFYEGEYVLGGGIIT